MFTALGLGIIFGFALSVVYGPTHEVTMTTADWFSNCRSGYVKFLQMIVMPLVFVSIVSAFTRLKLTSNIGKISSLIIGILLVTTAIAAAIGIFTTTSFNLESVQITKKGKRELQRERDLENNLSSLEAKQSRSRSSKLLPANPFLDLTGARSTSTIGVVIFAAFVGIAYLGVKRKKAEEAALFSKIIDTLFYAIVMRVVTLILRLTPYG